MAGTIDGGKKTAKTVKKKYGSDYYSRIGKKGGKGSSKKLGNAGGFASNPELASIAGRKGGKKSKRCKFVEDSEINENGTLVEWEWCVNHDREAVVCKGM